MLTIYDTFTGAADTNLTTGAGKHVGEVGANWTDYAFGTNGILTTGDGHVYSNNAGNSQALASGTIGPSMLATFSVMAKTVSGNASLVFNLDAAGAGHNYTLLYNQSISTWQVYRITGGASVLDAFLDPILIGQSRNVVVFSETTASAVIIQITIDGTTRFSLTDTDASRPTGTNVAIGLVGIGSASTGLQIGPVRVQSYPLTQTYTTVNTQTDGPILAGAPNTIVTSASGIFTANAAVALSSFTQPDSVNYPQVWQSNLNLQYLEVTGNQVTLAENGSPMNHIQSASTTGVYASIQGLANSFWCNDAIAILRTSDGSNPNTNGKTYARTSSYELGGTDFIVGIMAANCTISNFNISNTIRCQENGTLPDNGYAITDGPFSAGSITVLNGSINGYGKHGLGIVEPRSNSTITVRNVSVNLGSPYAGVAGGQCPFALFMASGAGTGNTALFDSCSVTYNTATIGTTTGHVNSQTVDFLTHSISDTTQEFTLIKLLNCTFGGNISQANINSSLFLVTGTIYAGISVVGNYIYNGTLSTTSTVASWGNGSSSFGTMTAQLQKSTIGAGSWSNVSGATTSPFAIASDLDYRVLFTQGTNNTFSNTSTAPLAAPVLTGTASNMTFTLEWTAIAGADSYNLYQTTPTVLLIINQINVIEFDDIINGVTYTFQVAAVDEGGNVGALSNILQIAAGASYSSNGVRSDDATWSLMAEK